MFYSLIVFGSGLYANGISAGSYIMWGNFNFNENVDTPGELAVYYSMSGSAGVVYNFTNNGNTVVSPVYGNTLYFSQTDAVCSVNDTKIISFQLVNNGNTNALISIDSQIVSYSSPDIADSVLMRIFVDANGDSILNGGDYPANSIEMFYGGAASLLLVINFSSGMEQSDTFLLSITAFNANSDTGGYAGASGVHYCGEGNSTRNINGSFGISADITCPDWADTFYQLNVENIIGTNNEYLVGLNKVDVLTAIVSSQTGLDSWTIRVNPVDTGGYLRLKSPDFAFVSSTDYSNVLKPSYGIDALLQADMFDSAFIPANVNYYADSPVITVNYSSRNVSTNYGFLRFYYLNPSDSVWYEATDLENGAAPNSNYQVFTDSSELSLSVQHLSHWWLGSITDTISVVKGADNLSNTVNAGDTFVAGSVFIMGDTAAGGDTLTMFGIENTGDLSPDSIEHVSLFEDKNTLGVLETGTDVFAGLLSLSGSGWVNNSLEYSFSKNDTGTNFIVAVKTKTGAESGDTFQMIIPSLFVKSTEENNGPVSVLSGFDSVTVISSLSGAAPAIIAFTSPTDSGTAYNSSSETISVSGTISGAQAGDTVRIYANGIECDTIILESSNLNSFSCSVVLNINENFIGAYLDTGALADWDTIAVNYLSSPAAVIFLTYPANNSVAADTLVSSITVIGTSAHTSLYDTILFYLNGDFYDTLILNPDTLVFSIEVLDLIRGQNVISANLLSDTGQIIFDDYMLVNYLDTISVKINIPADGYSSFLHTITVSGTSLNSNAGDSVNIYVDSGSGYVLQSNVMLASGLNSNWSCSAYITGSGEYIIAELIDKFGRTAYDTISVSYQISAVDIEIKIPEENGDTILNIITVSGTTLNTVSGDTVKIYVNGIYYSESVLSSVNGVWSGTVRLNGLSDSISVYLESVNGIDFDTIGYDYIKHLTVDLIEITEGKLVAGNENSTVMAFKINGAESGDTLQKFTITNIGTANESNFDTMKLWLDSNENYTWDNEDTLLSILQWNVDRWDTYGTIIYTLSGSVNCIVTVDVNNTIGAGQTFIGSIPSYSCSYVISDSGPVETVSNPNALTLSYGKKWTVMVYMNADNAAEWDASEEDMGYDLINNSGSDNNVNIVVQLDRIPGFSVRFDDWSTTHRFYVTTGLSMTEANAVSDWEDGHGGGREVNMADSQELVNFINWSISKYPADSYVLILWNHNSDGSSGWRSPDRNKTTTSRSLITDLTDSTTCSGMKMTDVRLALEKVGRKFDIIGFDMSFAGMMEPAYELKDYAYNIIASQRTIPQKGLPYHTILSDLKANVNTHTAETLSKVFISKFYLSNNSSGEPFILAAYRTGNISSMKSAIDVFCEELINWGNSGNWQNIADIRENMVDDDVSGGMDDSDDFVSSENTGIDLRTFFESFKGSGNSALENSITGLRTAFNNVVFDTKGQNDVGIMDNHRGMAIYLSLNYNPVYPKTIKFGQESKWSEFLRYYQSFSEDNSGNPFNLNMIALNDVTIDSQIIIQWNDAEDANGIGNYKIEKYNGAKLLFSDKAENGLSKWANSGFSLSNAYKYQGNYSFASGGGLDIVKSLTLINPVIIPASEKAFIKYWIYGDIVGNDSPIIEISDNGSDWNVLKGYAPKPLTEPFEIIDISSYQGSPAYIRFRYILDSNLASDGEGVFIDDIEIWSYNDSEIVSDTILDSLNSYIVNGVLNNDTYMFSISVSDDSGYWSSAAGFDTTYVSYAEDTPVITGVQLLSSSAFIYFSGNPVVIADSSTVSNTIYFNGNQSNFVQFNIDWQSVSQKFEITGSDIFGNGVVTDSNGLDSWILLFNNISGQSDTNLEIKVSNAQLNSDTASIVFKADTYAPAVVLVSPENDSTVLDNSPALVWNPVEDDKSGTQYYRLEWSASSSFDIYDSAAVYSGLSYELPVLTGSKYYWRVRLVDNVGNISDASVSDSRSFTLQQSVIYIVHPLDNSDTIEEIIIISGTTFMTMSGDTVEIIVGGISQSSFVLLSNNGNFSGTASLTGIGTIVTAVLTGANGTASDSIIVNYSSVDYLCPVWADTYFELNIYGLIGTDSSYIIGLNKVDVLSVTVGNENCFDSWNIVVDPVDTGGYMLLKSPDAGFVSTTNYSNVIRASYGTNALLQVDMYDSAFSAAGINFYSDSPVIKFNYSAKNISTNNGLLKFYYLNTSDSVWYEAADLNNGAAPYSGYQISTANYELSLPVQHLSHWWLGSEIDTVSIIKAEDVFVDTVYAGDTFVAGSVFIMGDTAAGGDTLVMFGIENIGNINPVSIEYVSLYEDKNNIGEYEAGTDIFAGLLNLSGSAWVNNSLNYSFSQSDTGNSFLILVKTSAIAVNGETFQMVIPSMSVKSADENTGPVSVISNFDSVAITSTTPPPAIIVFDYPADSVTPADTTV
ncbi:MAG TPA: clostripain-related cysteine peptidase, partial [bacterium]|nr:clostripain-related cysteine peptidase [bacterium]